jgi:hypothetical protein
VTGLVESRAVSGARRRAVTLAALAVGLAACGNGSRQSTTIPAGADTGLLLELNAGANDGHTVRWVRLPVPVFTNGIAQPDEVASWTAATGGTVTFTFVDKQPAHGISFRAGGGSDVCGLTTVEYENGHINSADVQIVVDLFRTRHCVGTIAHETGHAIGFLGHTADGGLMDPDGGNGGITPSDIAFVRSLYSFPPNSFVAGTEWLRGRIGRTGRGSITLVDPARR